MKAKKQSTNSGKIKTPATKAINSKAVGWKAYQEEAALFFRSIGLEASTDVTLKGVRTTHDVDVLVKSVHVGFEVTWLVECKHWKLPVSKLHVLALREIVSDVGADRGILLSEKGFQSGAIEAATLTNVKVSSLAGLRVSATDAVFGMRLRELYNRIENCNDQYWEIDKEVRIDHGLRADVGTAGYSGAQVVDFVRELLSRSFRGQYPFKIDALSSYVQPGVPEQYSSPQDVFTAAEALIEQLELKLRRYTASLKTT